MEEFLKTLNGFLFWKNKGKTTFRPGDRVRILPYEKIKETLDENNCCEGLFFMNSMAKFCGGDYKVLREVKWLYEEHSMKMLRCKDIVVLKDIVCDGKRILGGRDCDRSCAHFWKKTWLEKV